MTYSGRSLRLFLVEFEGSRSKERPQHDDGKSRGAVSVYFLNPQS